MLFSRLRADIKEAKVKDPAAGSKLTILLTYPGIHALICYRWARIFYRIKLKFVARVISQIARFFTGIEIHPGATIGRGVFIDHGMGVVIGETAVIGDRVCIFQGVTLGGTGKERGKRHPTIAEDVIIYANASVLGNIHIGKGTKIGAGAVVLKDAPPHSTLVGVPARFIGLPSDKIDINKVSSPCDRAIEDMKAMRERIRELETCIEKMKTTPK